MCTAIEQKYPFTNYALTKSVNHSKHIFQAWTVFTVKTIMNDVWLNKTILNYMIECDRIGWGDAYHVPYEYVVPLYITRHCCYIAMLLKEVGKL